MPYLLRVRISKSKANGYLGGFRGGNVREGDWGEAFVSIHVQTICSVEKQQCFGEVDDQYGTRDLRSGGLGAASQAKSGFEGQCHTGCGILQVQRYITLVESRASSPLHAREGGRG